MSRLLRIVLVLGLACGLLGGVVRPALAHSALVRSDPADNSLLAEAPRQVRLWFSEALAATFMQLSVQNGAGEKLTAVSYARDTQDATLLVVELPVLPAGVYSVSWKVLSAVDGHTATGRIVFGVGSGADLGTAASAAEEQFPWLEALLRGLNYAVLMALIGAAALLLWVLPRTEPQLLRRAWRWSALVAALGIVLVLASALEQAAALAALSPGSSFFDTLFQWTMRTRTGQAAPWRLVVLVAWVALASIYIRKADTQAKGPYGMVLIALLSLCLAGLQAYTSHAAALPAPLIPALLHAIHVLSMGAWAGGILALVVVARVGARFVGTRQVGAHGRAPLPVEQSTTVPRHAPLPDTPQTGGHTEGGHIGPPLPVGLARFTRLALPAAAITLGSGLVNSGLQAASPDALVLSAYGQSLLIKIALVLGVGLLGLLNSLSLHPALRRKLPTRLQNWPVRPALFMAEAGLGLLVVLATALMTTNPPPRGIEYRLIPGETNNTSVQNVDDLVVNLSVRPNRPGQNLINVRAGSTRRPAPAEVLRVIVRLRYQEDDQGQTSLDLPPVGKDEYGLNSSTLSLAGLWQVEVVVRRQGIPDSTAVFNWDVLPPGQIQAVAIARWPLLPVALALAAGVVLAALLVWLRVYGRKKTTP